MVRELLIALGCFIGTTVLLLSLARRKRNRLRRLERESYPRDTAIVHGSGRGPFAPSLSPFPLKLETFLRVCKIPHKVDSHQAISSKGKTPWMTYNGEELADTQFCIDYLKKKLDIDLMKDLTEEQRAVEHAFRIMVDEHLYWLLIIERWHGQEGKEFNYKYLGFPRILIFYVVNMVKKQTAAQGMGRHSIQDVRAIGRKDLKAISDYLGNNPYLMGDSPCEVDCSLMGCISQLLFQAPGSDAESFINEECPNIRDHQKRMSDNFWPDWQEQLSDKPSTFFRSLIGF